MKTCVSPTLSYDQLWRNARLSIIAHAVGLLRCPDLSYEQSMDGRSYNMQDSAGSYSTVAFGAARLVAAFFDVHSDRNPFANRIEYDYHRYFPADRPAVLALAEGEVLPYMLVEHAGAVVPVITTAFWLDAPLGEPGSVDPWPVMMSHGGWLIQNLLLDHASCFQALCEDHEFSAPETAVFRAIADKSLATEAATVLLSPSQLAALEACERDEDGLEQALRSLAEIGVLPGDLPDP